MITLRQRQGLGKYMGTVDTIFILHNTYIEH